MEFRKLNGQNWSMVCPQGIQQNRNEISIFLRQIYSESLFEPLLKTNLFICLLHFSLWENVGLQLLEKKQIEENIHHNINCVKASSVSNSAITFPCVYFETLNPLWQNEGAGNGRTLLEIGMQQLFISAQQIFNL